MTRLRWRWRRWRAAHYLWAATQAWYQHPTNYTYDAYRRALDFLEHTEAARP